MPVHVYVCDRVYTHDDVLGPLHSFAYTRYYTHIHVCLITLYVDLLTRARRSGGTT